MADRAPSNAQLLCALDAKLQRLARSHLALQRLEAQMDSDLEAVRARYAGRIARRRRAIEGLGRELQRFCEQHRQQIIPPGRKSLQTPHGMVGFRATAPSVVLLDGYSEQEVCRLLEAARLEELLRVRKKPDRHAIRKAHAAGELAEEELRALGLALTEQREDFYYDTNHAGG